MYLLGMTRKQEPPPGLSTRLTYLFKRALLDLEHLHAEHLAPVGMSGREMGVLLLLGGPEAMSQQQVAGRFGVDRTTMVGLVDALEGKGFLARRPDAGDRRRNVLELTEKGHGVLARAVRASDEAERQLLAVLDEEEASQLRSLLARLTGGRPEH